MVHACEVLDPETRLSVCLPLSLADAVLDPFDGELLARNKIGVIQAAADLHGKTDAIRPGVQFLLVRVLGPALVLSLVLSLLLGLLICFVDHSSVAFSDLILNCSWTNSIKRDYKGKCGTGCAHAETLTTVFDISRVSVEPLLH